MPLGTDYKGNVLGVTIGPGQQLVVTVTVKWWCMVMMVDSSDLSDGDLGDGGTRVVEVLVCHDVTSGG